MSGKTLYIIGNGFDRGHGMATRYEDFKGWLIDNGRIDVIQELQSAFSIQGKDDYLLWSELETALGQYDIDKVINWSWEDLWLTTVSIGGQEFGTPNFFLNTQLPDILSDAFTEWVHSIPMPSRATHTDLSKEAFYLTFNYTDTLESLYNIPEDHVLHIHGRASKGDKLIVGHNHMIAPSDYWDDKLGVRENNERMQRLTDMNTMCKPVYEIIERNEAFFCRLDKISDIYVVGHSCGEVDYPYFRKVKSSVAQDAEWLFNPFSDKDEMNIGLLNKAIGINNG